jgi:hypothetical protein
MTIPLWAKPGDAAQAPLGLPMCQNRLAVPTWSYAIELERPARILEVGSYSGGLAIALGLHCHMIGSRMISYDRNAQDEQLLPLAGVLGVDFRVGDIWALEAEVASLIAEPGKVFVLCDGGDKPRELMTFGKYLKSGDVIAAHDYNMYSGHESPPDQLDQPWPWEETKIEDGMRAADAHGLVPYMQEHFDLAGWLAYRKP